MGYPRSEFSKNHQDMKAEITSIRSRHLGRRHYDVIGVRPFQWLAAWLPTIILNEPNEIVLVDWIPDGLPNSACRGKGIGEAFVGADTHELPFVLFEVPCAFDYLLVVLFQATRYFHGRKLLLVAADEQKANLRIEHTST